MKSPIHALARAVIIQDDHILLAYPTKECLKTSQSAPLFYFLPGGHIEAQEPAAKALVREIYEEIGLQAEVERFLSVIEHAWQPKPDINDCHTHEINLVFIASIQGLSPQDLPPQKETHVAFCWHPIAQVETLDLRPAVLKHVLKQWLKGEGPTFLSSLE